MSKKVFQQTQENWEKASFKTCGCQKSHSGTKQKIDDVKLSVLATLMAACPEKFCQSPLRWKTSMLAGCVCV